MHTKFWSEAPKKIDHWEDLEVDWKLILEGISGKVWTGSTWYRTGSSSGFL